MAPSKKHPTNPNAPLYGKMPDLNIQSGLFDADQSNGSFESKCLGIKENVTYARKVFEKVKVNGKGKELFKTEEEFLRQLDYALFHYELFRPCVMPGESGELNGQRKYFDQLQKAVSNLNVVLGNMHEDHSRWLAHAGFVLPQFLTGEGLDNDFIQQSKSLEAATIKAQENLKGKNSGKNLELYLLIEQLADMYRICTGSKKSSVTFDEYSKDYKGSFFDLVKAIICITDIPDQQYITDHSIVNGIKLAQKS
jgi:hypothetical protein